MKRCVGPENVPGNSQQRQDVLNKQLNERNAQKGDAGDKDDPVNDILPALPRDFELLHSLLPKVNMHKTIDTCQKQRVGT